MPACNTYEASRIVFAPEETIYGAMTDLDQVRLWLLPDGGDIDIDKFILENIDMDKDISGKKIYFFQQI